MSLKQKINDLIIEYRNQSKGLSQIGKEESGINKFEPPIQAELIWFERRKHDIDFQILVFTHFSDIEDLDIQIHGPLKLKDKKNYIQKLDEIVHTDKWAKRKFPHTIKALKSEPDEFPYSIIYENIIANAKETFFIFFNDIVLTNKFEFPYFSPFVRPYNDVLYWIIFGNINDLDVKKYVNNELIKYQQREEQEKRLHKLIESPQVQKQFEVKKKHEINGFGTYFYPPIWIGESPQQSIEDKLTGQTVGSYVKNVIRTTYKERPLIIQNDGYLAICESNEAIAIDLMNEIVGTALLNDIGAYVIRKSEVGRITFDSRTWKFTSRGTPPSSKHQILEREKRIRYRSNRKIMRTPVTIEEVENVIKIAEKLTKNNDMKTYLWLHLESFTFYYNTVYTQSFLMSWFILEKFLNNQCEIIKKRNDLDPAIKLFLENNYLKPPVMIISLYCAGEITIEELNYFFEVKNIRNCIIHENIKCVSEEADIFRRYCTKLIKKFIETKMII